MSAPITCEILVSSGADLLPGYPLRARVSPSEVQIAEVPVPASATTTMVTNDPISTHTLLGVLTQSILDVRVEGQTTNEPTLYAGGLLLVVGGTLTGATTLALTNAATTDGRVTLVEAG